MDDIKQKLTRVKVRSVNDPDVKPEYVENLKKTKQGRIHLAQMFPNDFRLDPNDLLPDPKPAGKTRSPSRLRVPARRAPER
jgi:hypothetical protein